MTEQAVADKKTLIQCPVCQAQKTIDIPGYVFAQKRVGIIKIQIHAGSVCEHEFVAFVDQTGTARGYEKIDFQLQFTARSAEEHAATDKLYLEDLLETVGDFATLSVFRAFLFGYTIKIILGPADNPRFVERLNDLMVSFFPKEMNVKAMAQPLERREFLKLDVKQEEDLILDTSGLITNSPWGEKKRFEYENEILKKALEIIDAASQALLMQQEVANFKKRVEFVLKLLNDSKLIYENELKDKLSKEFRTKVSDSLLDLFILFVKRRMPESEDLLKKIHIRSFDKLKEGLW
jgi:hypothetical protein